MDVQTLWQQARERYPGIEVPLEAFAARLQLPAEAALEAGSIDHAGLYLAAACLAGQPAALRLLEAEHLSRLAGTLARFAAQGVSPDDVVQEVRVKLLGVEPQEPRLAGFHGRGSLQRWLEVMALRTAIDARRARKSPEPLSSHAQAALVTSGFERSMLQASVRPRFAAAVQAAFASLGARERRVLELHYLHGVTTAKIGLLYGTHRITVTRWLVAARAQVAAAVERELGTELSASSGAAGIYRLVRSELNLSLPRILAHASSAAAALA